MMIDKTDGALLNRLRHVDENRILKLSYCGLFIWMISPILMLVLNVTGISSYAKYGIWSTFLYVCGCICLISGGIFIFQRLDKSLADFRQKTKLIFPILLFALFWLWCAFCVIFASEKRVAVYGYGSLRDNLITYLFYGGFILGGFCVASSLRATKFVTALFLGSNVIVSLYYMVASLLGRGAKNNLGAEGEISFSSFAESVQDSRVLMIIVLMCFFAFSEAKTIQRIILALVQVVSILSMAYLGEGSSYFITIIAVLILTLIGVFSRNNFASFIDLALIFLFYTIGIKLFSVDHMSLIYNMFAGQIDMWKNGIDVVGAHPIVGVGPQNTMINSHSIFIQLAMYTGGTGLILFLFSIEETIRVIFDDIKKDCSATTRGLTLIICYLITGIFNQTYFYVAPLLFFLIGFYLFRPVFSKIDGK